jgi:hypothetical protein
MAAAPSHNPTAVTKKVYFDISIGGQPEGEVLAGHKLQRSRRMPLQTQQQWMIPCSTQTHAQASSIGQR